MFQNAVMLWLNPRKFSAFFRGKLIHQDLSGAGGRPRSVGQTIIDNLQPHTDTLLAASSVFFFLRHAHPACQELLECNASPFRGIANEH